MGKAMLNFDGSGRSRGTGEIIFATKAIAQKAVEEYDRAEVDGRPMYLKLADGGAAAKPKKKEIVVKQAARKTVRKKSTGRVGGAPRGRKVTRGRSTRGRVVKRGRGRGRGRRTSSFSKRSTVRRSSSFSRRRSTSRRGRGRGRGKGRRSSKPKTAEQLDAELEAYHKKDEVEAVDEVAAGQPKSIGFTGQPPPVNGAED